MTFPFDATSLAQWADRRSAEGDLPELVRQLLWATTPPNNIEFLRMPSAEGVRLTGWDGHVRARKQTIWVPSGDSFWEMGVGKDPGKKAAEDFLKRTHSKHAVDPTIRSQSTFVFVTPRTWSGKEQWRIDKEDERSWSSIHVFDAHDLEAWLETAPSVQAWIAPRLHVPSNLLSPEKILHNWRGGAPADALAFLTAGREQELSELATWIDGVEPVLYVVAEDTDESFAFTAIALEICLQARSSPNLPPCLGVETASARHAIDQSSLPLLILTRPEANPDLERWLSVGHRCIVSTSRSAPIWQTTARTIDVRRLRKGPIYEALTTLDLSRNEAERLLRDQGHDSLRLAQGLIHPHSQVGMAPIPSPAWSAGEQGRLLVRLLLLQTWNERHPEDQLIVARLIPEMDWGMLRERLLAMLDNPRVPLRVDQQIWYFDGAGSAWRALAHRLDPHDLRSLVAIATEVLSGIDPHIESSSEIGCLTETMRRDIEGLPPQGCSRDLQRGIVRTLALLATTPARPGTGSLDLAGPARSVVRSLFGRDADWRRWATLSPLLPDLAEAAPDEFLSGLERLATRDPEACQRLFASTSDPVFGRNHHTGIVWALENLGHSPQLFTRVAVVTGRLASIDPGEGTKPRPIGVLVLLFSPWLRFTIHSPTDVIAAMDALIEILPNVAWRLLLQLLPRNSLGFLMAPSRPRWRCWPVPEWGRSSPEDATTLASAYRDRFVRLADLEPVRLAEAVARFRYLPEKVRFAVLDAVCAHSSEMAGTPEGESLRHELRSDLHYNRSLEYQGQRWTPELLVRFQEAYDALAPDDLVIRHGWLFQWHPLLPDGSEHIWEEPSPSIRRAWTEALREILAAGGYPALVQLAETVQEPHFIGQALADEIDALLPAQDEAELIHSLLAEDRSAADSIAMTFANQRGRSRGSAWFEDLLHRAQEEQWTERAIVRILQLLPCAPATWDRLKDLGPNISHGYWALVNPYHLTNDDSFPRAIEALVSAGRLWTALDIASFRCEAAENMTDQLRAVLVDLLIRVFAGEAGDRNPSGSTLSGSVERLLEFLAQAPGDQANTIAQLELAYVGHHLEDDGSWQPELLQAELEHSPEFFATVVSEIYLRDDGSDDPDPESRTQRIWALTRLLEHWTTLPGHAEPSQHDEEALRVWVHRAREACKATGHADVGDRQIGEVIGRASCDAEDELWPCLGVRHLIETLVSDDIDLGILRQITGSRGITWRAIADGGAIERSNGELWQRRAEAIENHWPRTGAICRRAQEYFFATAESHDRERDECC